MNRLVRAVATVGFGAAGSALVFAAFMVVAARRCEPADLGVFAVAYALALFGTDLADLGTSSAEISRAASRSVSETCQCIRQLATGRLLILFCAAAFLVPIASFWGHGDVALAAISATCAMSFRMLMQTELRALRRYRAIAFTQMADRLVPLTILVLSSWATPTALLYMITTGSWFVVLVMRWKPSRPRAARDVLVQYWEARHVAMLSISTDVTLFDVSILAAIAGPAAVGTYTIASRLFAPIIILGSTLGSVLVRELGEDVTDAQDFAVVLRRSAAVVSLPVGVCAVAAMMWGQQLLRMLAGERYSGLGSLVVWVAGAAVASVYVQIVLGALQSRRDFRPIAIISGVSAVFYLVVAATLCRTLGATALPMAQTLQSGLSGIAYVALLVNSVRRVRPKARNVDGS